MISDLDLVPGYLASSNIIANWLVMIQPQYGNMVTINEILNPYLNPYDDGGQYKNENDAKNLKNS